MRVIFLDVDGVLNCRLQMTEEYKKRKDVNDISYHLHEPYIKNLSKLYHKYDNTVIVLSSSWKILKDGNASQQYDYLVDILDKYNISIYDFTPSINSKGKRCTSRPEEIKEWLKNHKGTIHWVSLDDDYTYDDYEVIGSKFAKHLCKTKYTGSIDECGLNNLKYHVALEILGGKYN